MFAGRATCPTCLTPANRRKRCGIRSLQDRVQITFGTALAEAGVDLAVIQALMGHEHVDAVAAYVHLAPTHVRAEFDAARAHQVRAAERFQRRWPTLTAWAAEPLEVRLSTEPNAGPFLLFAMLHGHLHPGYDWLLAGRLTGWWRELEFSPLGGDAAAFVAAAAELGFTERSRPSPCE